MAKSVTTTPPPAQRSNAAANPEEAPIHDWGAMSQALSDKDERIAALEAKLREAADTITALRMTGGGKPTKTASGETVTPFGQQPILLPFPLADANRAGHIMATGPKGFSIRFPEGPIGARRRQRFYSLHLGFRAQHAVMADGNHVDEVVHGLWMLLDSIRCGPEDFNAPAPR